MLQMVVAAIGLLFVMEGIFPFLSPKWWRRMMHQMIRQSDWGLHCMGLISMLVGLFLVCFAHHF